MSICLEVWGDYACFTRPEMKVERVSYDVMTPSAARGLIEAIYWHPGLRWHIDRIHVLAPIRFRFLYTGIIINHNKKLSQPTRNRRFFKKKAAFFSWPGLGKEWC